jgi:hypothetical protein
MTNGTQRKKPGGLQKETVKDLDAPAEKAGDVKGGKVTIVPGPAAPAIRFDKRRDAGPGHNPPETPVH